jgi:P-type Mg2+ transporter
VTSEAFWAEDANVLLKRLGSAATGLSTAEAGARLVRYGYNRLAPRRTTGWLVVLARQFRDPIVLLLLGACLLSVVLGDLVDASIIFAIVVLSGGLGFWQEHRAEVEVQRLLGLVRVHADVIRDGAQIEVPLDEIVPGDVLSLKAGDVVPCDCRVLSANALQVDQASLTGETFPRHKHPDPAPAAAALAERHSALFLGSHVVSGRGEALAVKTGSTTELGRLSRRVEEVPPPTGFRRGITDFGLLLARVTAVIAIVIFAVNLLLNRPFIDSVLFSLALAVGLTPQLLPAIVTVSLSTGASRMAKKQVIVRRFDAIEDFGAMDVLCTDKTGTITEGTIELDRAIDVAGDESPAVMELAAQSAALQVGFDNPIDTAILARARPDPSVHLLAEIPFDFTRKRLSVLVSGPRNSRLVTKGAYESVLAVCVGVSTRDGPIPLDQVRAALDSRYRDMCDAGYRVLAVAIREGVDAESVSVADEQDMTLAGLLAFTDPPKSDGPRELAELRELGVSLRMITGDNRYAAMHIARAVGMDEGGVLSGEEIEAMTDRELQDAVGEVAVFAEVDPLHKERILLAFRHRGAVVGYLGDGINDAGALHIADVGISVESAVDVAKSAAGIVLLSKDLGVLSDGVRLGRQTFSNTLKYIFTTVSANFGNMASMAAASALLPFLPLLPRQILLLNFLSDIPGTTLATDAVDPEQLQRPGRWDIRFIRNFMVLFGLLSSMFDVITFAVLLGPFHAGPGLFQTGWFVGSTLTELSVLLVLRTRRPAVRSRPGTALIATSAAVAAITLAIPYLAFAAKPLGLVPLPVPLLGALVLVTLMYVVSAELLKRRFYAWIDRQRPATSSPHKHVPNQG